MTVLPELFLNDLNNRLPPKSNMQIYYQRKNVSSTKWRIQFLPLDSSVSGGAYNCWCVHTRSACVTCPEVPDWEERRRHLFNQTNSEMLQVRLYREGNNVYWKL